MRKASVMGTILSGVFFLALAGCTQKGASAKEDGKTDGKRFNVKAAEVKKREISRVVEAVGSFLPFEEVTVSSEVEGKVDKVLVDIGDHVQQGQVLVSLAPEELQYQLDASAAKLRQTLAQLGLQNEQEPLKSDTDVPAVQKAAADLRQTDLNYQRAKGLFEQALIPKQQLDDAEAKYNSARATYDATLQQVQVTKASVEQYRAEADLARKKLRDAQIKSPFSGWVKERLVSPGQYLRVQAPVVTVFNGNPLKFVTSVPERMAPWVTAGNTLQLQVEAYPGRIFTGRISRVNPASNEQNRSFSIEAIIENREGLLKPGFFAKASITTQKKDAVLIIPADALFFNYGVYKVFTIDENRISTQNVTIGDKVGSEVEILSGVQENDLVAVADLAKLNEGMEVEAALQ
ncbi:MAG: efflux RND transporter periplasmic adaptor subunit [Acidobacteria bacterium]|nr:efflux RND transporter periplasmic adaptor subunit [Acidobacteriota bacterium]